MSYKYNEKYELTDGYPRRSKLFGSFARDIQGSLRLGNHVYTFKGRSFIILLDKIFANYLTFLLPAYKT